MAGSKSCIAPGLPHTFHQTLAPPLPKYVHISEDSTSRWRHVDIESQSILPLSSSTAGKTHYLTTKYLGTYRGAMITTIHPMCLMALQVRVDAPARLTPGHSTSRVGRVVASLHLPHALACPVLLCTPTRLWTLPMQCLLSVQRLSPSRARSPRLVKVRSSICALRSIRQRLLYRRCLSDRGWGNTRTRCFLCCVV